MSKLQEFLSILSNHELARFYEYRYPEFLKGSKEKIDEELKRRAMDKNNLSPHINPHNHQENSTVCPQCYSSKFYTSTEIETVNYSYASVDLEVDYRTCLVCLYSEEKDRAGKDSGFVGPFGFIRTLINRKK